MVRLDLLVYIFLLVGDFFDGSTMPKADLYLLGHVCHDWTDSECAKIAKNVFDSLNKGQLLIVKLL